MTDPFTDLQRSSTLVDSTPSSFVGLVLSLFPPVQSRRTRTLSTQPQTLFSPLPPALGIFSFDPTSFSLSLSNLKPLSISEFCPSLQALALLHPLIYSSYQIHIAKRVRRATFHLHAAALQIRYTTLTRKMTVAPHAKSLCL